MKSPSLRVLPILLLLAPAGADAPAAALPDAASPPVEAVAPAGAALATPAGSPEVNARWICKRADNVCGLDDSRILSSPAKIDYERVLEATPPMQELRRKGIDPDSPEGRVLRNKAQDELRRAADEVRRTKGHCSVWKTIRHSDGRDVPDLTDDVIAQLGG